MKTASKKCVCVCSIITTADHVIRLREEERRGWEGIVRLIYHHHHPRQQQWGVVEFAVEADEGYIVVEDDDDRCAVVGNLLFF